MEGVIALNVFTRVIEAQLEFQVVERQCEIASAAFAAALQELEGNMDGILQTLAEDEQDAFFSNVNDEWIEVAQTMPLLHAYSQFMLAYSILERLLNGICDAIKAERGYKLSFRDLGDQGISRARTYLAKLCDIHEPFNAQAWQRTKLLAEIRNAIAHRGGFVDSLPDKSGSLYSQLAKVDGIELKQEIANQEDAQIVFGIEFVTGAIATYRDVIVLIRDAAVAAKPFSSCDSLAGPKASP